MNDILKQRLVGALVLIALGVIFWPVIFVESERGELDRQTQIEPMPALEGVSIPAPQPLANVEPVRPTPTPSDEEVAALASADQVTLPSVQPRKQEPVSPAAGKQGAADSTAKPSTTPFSKASTSGEAAVPALPKKDETAPAPESPALDEQGIPIAWVLQVASVSTREKADKLTADLIARDYKAYHRAIRRNDLVLYRVFIGPVFEREKLAAVKRDVDRELNVSAIIARYVP